MAASETLCRSANGTNIWGFRPANRSQAADEATTRFDVPHLGKIDVHGCSKWTLIQDNGVGSADLMSGGKGGSAFPLPTPDGHRAFPNCTPPPPIAARAERWPSLHQESPPTHRACCIHGLAEGEAVRRYSSTLQPITAQRIERALDRVAEIIVARGDQGETWLPLYEYLERALQDCHAKERRLAVAHQRVKRLRDRTATRSS